MFAHHVDNTMEKKLFLKKHNFNNQAYTLCVGFLLCDFQSVTLRRCVTNKPPAMRVRIEGYTKKLQSRYNKGVQAYHIAKGEKIWLKKLIV